MSLSRLKTIFFLVGLFALKSGFSSDSLSRAQLLIDLDSLVYNLKKWHPDLYRYRDAEQFTYFVDSIKKEVPDMVSSDEAYRTISYFSNFVQDGHTVFYPSAEVSAAKYENDRFIPFGVVWDGVHLYLKENYSRDSLPVGAEITKVNGELAADFIMTVRKRLPRDGDIWGYSTWIINNYLASYYNFMYGDLASLTVTMNDVDYTVTPLKKKEIYEHMDRRYPGNNKKYIGLTLLEKRRAAVLRVGGFVDLEGDSVIPQLNVAFDQLAKAETEHLILDLRGNQGGDLFNGDFLLQNILQHKFQLVDGFYKVCNPLKIEDEERLCMSTDPADSIYDVTPFVGNFTGKLYVLINGGSFSCTGMVARCIKEEQRGIFIGQETGGSAWRVSGDPIGLELSQSKISYYVASNRYDLPKTVDQLDEGVRPEYAISLRNTIGEKDPSLEFALKMIDRALK